MGTKTLRSRPPNWRRFGRLWMQIALYGNKNAWSRLPNWRPFGRLWMQIALYGNKNALEQAAELEAVRTSLDDNRAAWELKRSGAGCRIGGRSDVFGCRSRYLGSKTLRASCRIGSSSDVFGCRSRYLGSKTLRASCRIGGRSDVFGCRSCYLGSKTLRASCRIGSSSDVFGCRPRHLGSKTLRASCRIGSSSDVFGCRPRHLGSKTLRASCRIGSSSDVFGCRLRHLGSKTLRASCRIGSSSDVFGYNCAAWELKRLEQAACQAEDLSARQVEFDNRLEVPGGTAGRVGIGKEQVAGGAVTRTAELNALASRTRCRRCQGCRGKSPVGIAAQRSVSGPITFDQSRTICGPGSGTEYPASGLEEQQAAWKVQMAGVQQTLDERVAGSGRLAS